jgi:TPP-dependent trihydroxycyclohexane-1,2-dione (THcHDO) dehydratase
MEPAEFILKLIILMSLCAGILGMIVESSQFEGVVLAQDNERLSIDMAHAAAAMPCLTEKVGGEARDGLLLESQLDAYQDSYDACISLAADWTVTVTDGTKTWTMGRTITGTAPSKTIPVAIRKADGTVVPGTLTAKVKK